jgi:spermidine synthase
MGGLALGNRLFGSRADNLRRPVLAYGVLEIIIGLYALLFPGLDKGADALFVTLGSPLIEKPVILLIVKGLLAACLLLGPTILMGGTLPLLAAWLQRTSNDAGRNSARFYSTNSLGAVAGSAIAGFFLVQRFGMISTLQITAAANILIGSIAVWLGRHATITAPRHSEPSQTRVFESVSQDTLRWAGLMVAMTGAVSMGLEVLAARSLALMFGSSLQSFAIVLMAFILGIGLGSAAIASLRQSGKSSETLIVVLL